MQRPFTKIAALLLGLISLLQLTRFLMGWPVAIDGVSIPDWLSGFAFAVLGGVAMMVWREARR